MTHPDILAALARERSGAFRAAAKTARRAGQARRHRQADRASGTRTTPLLRLLPWLQPWQGRGLGTELLSRLSDRARQAGIDRFTTLVAAENAAMARLLRNLGACLAGHGPGTMEYEVALVIPPGDPGYDRLPEPVSQPC